MAHKVLIATRSFGSTSAKPWVVLAEADCEVFKADMSKKMTEKRLIDLLQEMDAVIVGSVPMTAHVLENASNLKVVCAHGVGVDHIDLDAASRLGITIAHCPGANDPSVADLTIGLMIAVARSIPRGERELRQGRWGRYHGAELWNKTLGLIGLGRIGRGVAKRAAGFDMEVIVYDPYVEQDPTRLTRVKFDSFENVIKQADFLSLHTPLNDETKNMIGSAELEAMKPSAYLINTARGGLVDEQALFKALSEGQIAGAAFDVFIEEPPGSSPLFGLDNMVVTPHIGAHTQESIERVGVMAAQSVIATLQGGQPLHRVR